MTKNYFIILRVYDYLCMQRNDLNKNKNKNKKTRKNGNSILYELHNFLFFFECFLSLPRRLVIP